MRCPRIFALPHSTDPFSDLNSAIVSASYSHTYNKTCDPQNFQSDHWYGILSLFREPMGVQCRQY